MVTRISGRYTCGTCGEGYHDTFKVPTTEGQCNKCQGTDFKRRADDTAETVAARLEAYHAQTSPLIEFYASQGALARVDAMGAIDDIATDLGAIVSRVTA
jgi:adenylate kinase